MTDNLGNYIQLFESAEQSTVEARHQSALCRDYYDGKQWTPAEVDALNKRNQRAIVINRIKPKVQYLKGIERMSRTDPKALPRNPRDDDVDAVSAAIRYVGDNNNFDTLRSEVWENLLIEGVGGIEVGVERKGASFNVTYKRYEFDRIFFDPHSRARDFSDSRYLGGVIWMDAADAKARWPDKTDVIDNALTKTESDTETYADVPRTRWNDSKRKRVRVVLIYRDLPDGWTYAWYCAGGFLKGPAVSPYYDYDEEQQACPLIFTSAYVDNDGARYSEVKQFLDVQYEINRRRTRGLHLINQRQTFGNQQSGVDAAQVKRELSKADGHVDMQAGEWNKDFGIIPSADMTRGNMQMLEEAKAEIDQVGPSSIATGRDEREVSGRAFIAQQMSTQTEVGPLLDALRHWQHRVYRATWNRIRQYWQGEKWIRVTDDKNNIKWVGLNSMQDEQGQPLQQPQNQLSEMDVDIIISDVPDTANVQQETFAMFTNAVRASGQQVPLQIWLELMPGFPNKDRVLEQLQPEQDPEQMQLQQQVQQLQMAQARAELAEKMASVAEKQSSAIEKRASAAEKQTQALENRTRALENTINALVKKQQAPSEIQLNYGKAMNEFQNAMEPPGPPPQATQTDEQEPPQSGFFDGSNGAADQ